MQSTGAVPGMKRAMPGILTPYPFYKEKQKTFARELLTEAELQACQAEPDWQPAEKLPERTEGAAK